MVANNLGRVQTQIMAGNSIGVLHRAVQNHKFNQIFLRGMNNSNKFSSGIFAPENELFAQISSYINTIKEYAAESLSRLKQYMPQKFVERSSKFCFSQEFIEKVGIL